MITDILLVWAAVLLVFAFLMLLGRAHFNTPKPIEAIKAENLLCERINSDNIVPARVAVDAVIQQYEKQMRTP